MAPRHRDTGSRRAALCGGVRLLLVLVLTLPAYFSVPAQSDAEKKGEKKQDEPSASAEKSGKSASEAKPPEPPDACTPDPSSKVNTLEDFFGDTGNKFQGAIGIVDFEADPNTPAPQTGYGVGADDMVVKWREVRLDEDTTDCAIDGKCAVHERDATPPTGRPSS